MVDLKKLDTAALVDLLALHTTNYLILADSSPNDDEFAKCFLTIRAIQKEIQSRKLQGLQQDKKDQIGITE